MREKSHSTQKSRKSEKSHKSHKSGGTKKKKVRNSELKIPTTKPNLISDLSDHLEQQAGIDQQFQTATAATMPLGVEKYAVLENTRHLVCKNAGG